MGRSALRRRVAEDAGGVAQWRFHQAQSYHLAPVAIAKLANQCNPPA